MKNRVDDFVYNLTDADFVKYNFDKSVAKIFFESQSYEKFGVDNNVISVGEHTSVTLKGNGQVEPFAAMILCGGKATRFNGIFKAIYEIDNVFGDGVDRTFLEINIRQILKFECEHSVKVPIIIYDDFGTHDPIVDCLELNNYFGKSKDDYYFVEQTSGLRYLPSLDLLDNLGLGNFLSKEERKIFPPETNVFITSQKDDTFVGTGHFVFNALINSKEFVRLLKNEPSLNRLVVCNCDNLGKKYYSSLLSSRFENCMITTYKQVDEKMDGVYIDLNNNYLIIPYFSEVNFKSNVGFTGTIYLTISDILKCYGFKDVDSFVYYSGEDVKIDNRYYPILKRIANRQNSTITLHFESVLAEISKFIQLKPMMVDRDLGFFPFKSISDLNDNYLDEWKSSVLKNNYL